MFAIVMVNRVLDVSATALVAAWTWLATPLKTLRRILANRSQVRALAQMDERGLQDIGLSRAEVSGALDSGLFANPSLVLRARDIKRQHLVGIHRRSRDRHLDVTGAAAGQTGATPAQTSFLIACRAGRECIA
jgi:uncharacterized protein YjiS (DUF1127 family)